MIDFKNIKYLKNGNIKQQSAYIEICKLNILSNLNEYNPVLAGTVPIEIDIFESDLDIICECHNHDKFSDQIVELFGKQIDFVINTKKYNGIKSTIAKFKAPLFTIEIFGQSIPVEKQNAYKHMLIEHKLLKIRGPKFRERIIELKESGIKTEAAFAKLLGLKGNPFEELLKIEP